MSTLSNAARIPARCPAAHPNDGSGCAGATDAVRLVDRTGVEVYGCVPHAAVALASITGARVYPGSRPGAAIEVYRRAQTLTPYQFTPAAAAAPAAGGGGW